MSLKNYFRNCLNQKNMIAKKHQKLGFKKYLDDALAEVNETMVGIDQSRDLYDVDKDLCFGLNAEYEIIAKQLYRLAEAWVPFTRKEPDSYN